MTTKEDIETIYPAGKLTLVCGCSMMGKTTTAISIAMKEAKSGVLGILFSLEKEVKEMHGIMMKQSDAQDFINNIAIDASHELTVEEVIERAVWSSSVSDEVPMSFIVIDYVNLLTSVKESESRDEELAKILETLGDYAKTSGIAVVAMYQMSKETSLPMPIQSYINSGRDNLQLGIIEDKRHLYCAEDYNALETSFITFYEPADFENAWKAHFGSWYDSMK